MPNIEKRIINLLKKCKNEFLTISYYTENATNYISDSVFNITGYTASELIEQMGGLLGITLEEDRYIVKKIMGELFSGIINEKEISFRILTRENKTKWINQHIFLERDKLGNVTVVETINSENYEQQDTEAKRIGDIQKLIELNAEKDKFISIVSHDLRAPFTSILGFSEILLNEKELAEEEKAEYLSYVNSAAQTQLQLVNHLLDWSRLQTGRLSVEPHRINARSLIANAASLLTGSAIRKNINVYISVDVAVFIHADERLLTQAICNLIGNAIKFTPNGKSITITTEQLKAGFVEIIVKDEGIGISEKDQSKLFKLDQKFSLSGTEGEKGTGLGLILVKDIIEKHGGEIWFFSKPEYGTEFHFTIPEARNIVLLVEDDADLLHLYKNIISKSLVNFEIMLAANGYEAMQILLKKLPSLVITDHEMPLMSGIQLCEAIRKRESNKDIPVIVISAKFNESLIQKYIALGVKKLIPKPIESRYLIDIIQESIG
ncbi:MAG: hybrid sensor histidine kinase/response regulator [bacterium]